MGRSGAGMDSAEPHWVFDPMAPSGSRRGGDPAEYAFEPTLESFVREVIQNANDQRIDTVRLTFNFFLLEGDSLRSFMSALHWDELHCHLVAAIEAPHGEAIRQTLDTLNRSERLLLLNVCDSGTSGLTGEESGDKSNFTALCKDILYSHKEHASSAGGSFGLGKSVLWRFSDFSTVVFCSNLREDPPGRHSPRLIGRAELPSHYISQHETAFDGHGWFGHQRPTDGGRRAESIWSEEAARLAAALHLGRDSSTGTSILVVGFREPADEDEPDLGKLDSRIRTSAARNFWPALCRDHNKLAIGLTRNGDSPVWVSVSNEPTVWPFVECLRNAHAAGSELLEVGDIARREIHFEIPNSKPEPAGKRKARATLLVRLAENDTGELVNHVAQFRAPGMVVQYRERRRLAIGARPFHAILLCGSANPQPNDDDKAFDLFLRAAEPPGHDRWGVTVGLKEQYRAGYKKALDEMGARVDDALRDLVVASVAQGGRGPDRLSQRFPLEAPNKQTRTIRGKSAFTFHEIEAHHDGRRWVFTGILGPRDSGHDGWTAELTARLISEEGETIIRVPLAELTEAGGADWETEAGKILVRAEPQLNQIRIEGVSALSSNTITSEGALELEITGRVSRPRKG